MSVIKANKHQIGSNATASKNIVLEANTDGDLVISKGVHDGTLTEVLKVKNSGGMEYIPAGTGAVATTVQSKLREFVSVKDFGAIGDGVTDDAAAIQKAINAAYGKTLYVPTGQYYLNTVTNSALLSIAGRIKIVADFGAAFVYGAAATATTDVIRVDPQTIADEGIEIHGLWIYEKTGSPARDVIRIRLDATHGLKKLRLSNCLFRSKTGYAVSCFNSSYLNTNGLFFTDIDRCEFVGGFYSDGHGDTTRIANSVFTGQNRGIEIEMLPVSAGDGASSCLSIINNNITSTGGAIFIRRGRNVLIEGNNIEQLTDFTGNYCIQLNNVDYDITGVSWVRGNKIEPNDPISKCGSIALYRCKKTIIEGNQIGTSAKTAGITIGAALTESSEVNVFTTTFTYLTIAGVFTLLRDALTSAINQEKLATLIQISLKLLTRVSELKAYSNCQLLKIRGQMLPVRLIKLLGL